MKKWFVLILILGLVPVGYGVFYEDVFEDFINDDNLTVTSHLVVNSTTYALGFNMSEMNGAYVPENTTDYTIVDVDSTGGTISKSSATRIYLYNMDRDETEYCYIDMGAGYFQDFEANFSVSTLNRISNPQVMAVSFANSLGEIDSVGDTFGLKLSYYTPTNKWLLQFLRLESGGFSGTNHFSPNANPYTAYCTIGKVDGNLYCEVYSDSARTSLLQNLTLSFSYDPHFRYVYWGQSDDDALGGRSISAYVDDLQFRQAGYLEGYAVTTNLLSGISGDATAILYNSSIPQYCNATLEISDDNSTWVDSQGASSYDSLQNGTQAINLQALGYDDLYLRWNFSRVDSATQVELFDYRVLYESSCSGVGGVGVLTCVNHTAQSAVVATIEGNQTESAFVDGDWLNITEIVGTPAFDARFNYTIPTGAQAIGWRVLGYYDGNAGHNVTFEAYNYSSGAWVILDQMPDGSAMKWFNNSISAFNQDDFVSNNTLMTRLYHYSAGNVNHHVHIDFMQVCYLMPSSVTGAGTPFFLHWIYFVLFLVLTTIIIAKQRRII